ncbi:MAG TPA: TonB-dependent receptor [Rhizomicrobium sp.]|nr:TonB-dependent receptor [Rhizomicrobium sp.]
MTSGKKSAYLLGTSAVAALMLGMSAARAQQVAQNIETVTVTGSLLQAADIKRNAPVVLDIAPLAQIRSLPDSNAAEVLQRLPGVSMESDTGEGRFINIRGMDADLNGTTYDGVRMTASNPSSPQSGARAVAFDAFPSGILGAVEVIKSFTPEMDAEGLGGVVNIQPRSIPEGADHLLEGSLGGGIESLRGTPVYKGDFAGGAHFFNDKMSVIFSYGFEQDHRGIDDIEADYANDPTVVPPGTSAFLTQKAFSDLQFRWYQYHRLRQGYSGGITFSPNSTTNFYIRALSSGYVERANKHEFVLTNLSDNIVSIDNTTGDFTVSGAQSHYNNINTKEKLGNDLVEAGGDTLVGTVRVDARISWTEGHDEFPYSVNAQFANPTPFNLVYNNIDADRPSYTAQGINVVDPSLYTTLSGSNSPSRNSDKEYGGVINVSIPVNWSSDAGLVKFGGSVRQRTRGAQQYAASLNPTDQNLVDFVTGPDIFYYHGIYNIGPQPIFSELLNIPQSPVMADPSTFSHDSENVYAGYGQYADTFGDVDVIGGVRVETTTGVYGANTITTDALGNTFVTPNIVRHNYNNVFPDVSAIYHASDVLQLRAAFSTSIARPGFNQITASQSIDLSNAKPIITQGNPNLKPTIGHNFDLTASYLLPNNGIVYAGLFYKAFDDYIVSTENTNALNVPGFVGQSVDLISFSNIGAARTEGVELEYTQQFDFLPDALSGLGFDGNLTYVASKGQIRPGEEHTLPQTSPFNYNAAIFYQNGPIFAKIAAAYVSANLWSVGSNAATDLYSQPRFRLDFHTSYDFTDQIQGYFDIKNITNTHLNFTQTNDRNFPVQNEFYDADYLFGIRIKL